MSKGISVITRGVDEHQRNKVIKGVVETVTIIFIVDTHSPYGLALVVVGRSIKTAVGVISRVTLKGHNTQANSKVFQRPIEGKEVVA